MLGEREDEDVAIVEAVEVVQEVRIRPSTAVVRIVLREPTPPPPPIDFDAKAAIIQVFSCCSFFGRRAIVHLLSESFVLLMAHN